MESIPRGSKQTTYGGVSASKKFVTWRRDRIVSLSKAIHAHNRQVDDLYERLEGLYQQRERKESDFNRRLGALETD